MYRHERVAQVPDLFETAAGRCINEPHVLRIAVDLEIAIAQLHQSTGQRIVMYQCLGSASLMILTGSRPSPNTWYVCTLVFRPRRWSIVERSSMPRGVWLSGGTMDWEDLVTVKKEAIEGRGVKVRREDPNCLIYPTPSSYLVNVRLFVQ